MRDMRAYVDSNVFIMAAVSTEEDGDDARKLLTFFAKGDASGLTSALTFDEVFYRVKKEINREAAIKLLENLLVLPNLVFLSADTSVISASLSVLKRQKIEPRDAIHVATSMLSAADVFVTEDKSLRKIIGVKALGIKEATAKIENEARNR